METFVQLYQRLDQTQSTQAKQEALVGYFRRANPHEAAWVVRLLCGEHARRFISPRKLRQWVADYLGLPIALVESCYQQVGDLAETIALLLPNRFISEGELPPLYWLAEREFPRLAEAPEAQQRATLISYWQRLSFYECFLFHKLLLGAMRVGVADGLLMRALAEALHLPEGTIAQKLACLPPPSPAFYAYLHKESGPNTEPYPFFLAYPIEDLGTDFVEKLGPLAAYQIEWKWDGVRVQVVRRAGRVALWSRGGVLLTESFPELVQRFQNLPSGTVIDGELLIVREGRVQPFFALQRRLLRKKLTPALLREAPAEVFAYDILEWEGQDIRQQPLSERRALLEKVAELYPFLQVSPTLRVSSWEEIEAYRAEVPPGAEGIMLKRKESPYLVGRRRGYWWKYKQQPYSVDAVLLYAQQGHGRRSGWFTDLTFALWNERGELVPFAKAYSGLTDAEMQELTRWIRTHAVGKVGPVVKVPPQWVFEIAFEGIQRSRRHACGYAVRFPRILRWRKDKSPAEADTLSTLAKLSGDPHFPTGPFQPELF
ncbi:MAG: ATP-dependent DNA ligase [Bacteroidia bacterium]|nr:ATP-dependent DNA ligase [Bacteroidia bacterium]